MERAGNSESSPNSILWLWVPACAGTTAEFAERLQPQSATTFTRSLTFTWAVRSRPLSTRKRSAG